MDNLILDEWNNLNRKETDCSDNAVIIDKIIQSKTAQELIEFWDYPYEKHCTTTSDGYEIMLHRIPNGHLSSETTDSQNHKIQKPIVLIWHGLSISSDVFLCNTSRERNMALIMADAGMDVWLANTRGNKYSKKHTHETCPIKYWEISIDHLAKYDVPAAVDYILQESGTDSLAYVGYSQGTSQLFAALSLNEELNHKIHLAIALAPAMRPKPIDNDYINTLIRACQPHILFPLLGNQSFLPFVHTVRDICPSSTYASIIEGALYTLLGWKCEKFGPQNRRKALYNHLFSDAAVSNLVHWFQIIESGEFSQYDHIPNYFNYLEFPTRFNPKTLVKYPTRHITTKLHLFIGELDSISDLNYLNHHLPHHAQLHVIPEYEHMDFLWAECAFEKCWKPVIDLILHSK